MLSLNASYRLTRKVNVAMGIDNLLDATYAEHVSKAGAMVAGYVQSQRINEAGRTLWLKFDVSPRRAQHTSSRAVKPSVGGLLKLLRGRNVRSRPAADPVLQRRARQSAPFHPFG